MGVPYRTRAAFPTLSAGLTARENILLSLRWKTNKTNNRARCCISRGESDGRCLRLKLKFVILSSTCEVQTASSMGAISQSDCLLFYSCDLTTKQPSTKYRFVVIIGQTRDLLSIPSLSHTQNLPFTAAMMEKASLGKQ